MLEQLRASERQNGILKKKLEVSQEQREEFLQVAVDKEKQLQAALVHLGVAQVRFCVLRPFPGKVSFDRLVWLCFYFVGAVVVFIFTSVC